MPFPLSPSEEDTLDEQLAQADIAYQAVKPTVSYDLAQAVTSFYKDYPDVAPGAIISTARAYVSGVMDEQQAKQFLGRVLFEEARRNMQDAAEKRRQEAKKSWWDRNVVDNFRTGVRWGGAGLQWTSDVAQNLIVTPVAAALQGANIIATSAQTGSIPGQGIGGGTTKKYTFNPIGTETLGTAGSYSNLGEFAQASFYDATLLGQMIENPDLVGDGYFPNARIYELQGEEARKLRGTIDGHALTAGRILAPLVTQPGSREYNILSGIVDAAVAVKAPAIPGGALVARGARLGVGSTFGVRTLVGLTEANSAYIIPAKVSQFLDTAAGRSVIKRIVKIKDIDEAIRIFPDADAKFWRGVVDAKDVNTARQFIDDTLGLGDFTRGIGPKRIDQIDISRLDDVKRNIPYFGSQKESKVARLLARVPGQHVVVEGGSDRAVATSIRNVNDYLIQARIPRAERVAIVERLTDGFITGDGSVRNVLSEVETASRRAMKQFGVDDTLNDLLHRGLISTKEVFEKDLYGALDDVGDSANWGGTFTWMDESGNIVTSGHPLQTAGVQTEMMKHSVFLPDPRRVRRLASGYSPVGLLTTKQGLISPVRIITGQGLRDPLQYGNLRTPLAFLDWAQGYLWKPFTLMTGGYVYRNMSDSFLRQSFAPGVQTGAFHPLELIQVAMNKKFKGDIWGVSFKGDPEDLIRAGQKEMAEAVSASVRENVGDVNRHARERLTGVWERVRRGDGKEKFTKAIAAEISLLYGDDVARKVAAGELTDDILEWMKNTPEGRRYVDTLQNMWKNKVIPDNSGNKTIGTVIFKDANGVYDENNLRQYIDTYVRNRVDATTGRNDLLKEVIATGKYTDAAGKTVDAIGFSRSGTIIRYEDRFLADINKIVDDPTVKLKDTYKAQILLDDVQKTERGMNMVRGWNKVVDYFFAELYPKREAFLNRSPVFRQEYYTVIGKLADELAPGEAATILANIEAAAKAAGETFNKRFFFRYVGNDDTAKVLWEKAKGAVPSNGKLTFEELDAYAKGAALDTTKQLFYNAAERSNFGDIMQIISPFASAWAEVMKKWGKTITSDPEAFKRSYIAVQGLTRADLDNDGRGFFYRNPVNGEYVFNYPFGSQAIPLMGAFGFGGVGAIVAGLPGALAAGAAGYGAGYAAQKAFDVPQVDFVAPAKSLNMGFNIYPGVGPWAQVAAGWVLQGKPDFDWARKFLIPYGTPMVGLAPNPAWWQKMWAGFVGDPENDRFMGDMTMQVMEVLAASGEYDLSTEVGMQQLQDDAVGKARVLMVARALGQFVGPSRPTPQLVVPLDKKAQQLKIDIDGNTIDLSKTDIYATEVSKYFRQLQDANYDTAVATFLETFGDDFMLYMAGKTKAVAGGLDASTEFGNWERANTKFFSTYDEVAGYFAPTGSKFDYQVYVRQIESGLREKLTPQEMVEESQRLVGTAIYRRLVRAAGPKPNDAQKQILREERNRLYDQFPGFAKAVLDTRAFEAKLNVLYEATFDSRMDENPVALGLREYLKLRDQALQVATDRGVVTLGAKANEDLRDILRAEGERLSTVYPDFSRVWERLLLQEVDLDSEG